MPLLRVAPRSHSLGLLLTLAQLATAGPLGAQAEYGATCRPLARCSSTGATCDTGTRPVTIAGTCFCASGTDASLGAPTLCCGDAGGCPGAAVCVNVDGTPADICAGEDIELCIGPGDVIGIEQAHACFTPPTETVVQPYWRRGDCDEDGVPNGQEVALGRDPCCNEGTDLGCCLAVDGADALACCTDTGAGSATECCLIHDGTPEMCCADDDPVACCADASEPLGCCESIASDDVTCCPLDEDPAACCLDAGDEPARCCALEGADDEDECSGIDAGTPPDAGEPDVDASTAADAGTSTMDTGTANEDGGTSFGGGGGCVCSASRRGPSPLALIGLALAITIPIFRRRRAS